MLFDKNTHRWERLKVALPAGRTSPITFCDDTVLVAEGNQVFEFQETTFSWEPIRAGVIEGAITGITVKEGTLYLATGNGLYVNEDYKSLGSSPSLFFPWKILPEAKSYILTQSTSVHPSLIHVRTLCEAVERGAKKEVESLIKQGVDVNATTDPTGLTPLHLAASKGDKDMVELLLEHGANINARNMSRLTPLRMAVRGGHIEVADFLMSKGGKK